MSGPARPVRGFASDTAAGAHPAVLEALARAGEGHAPGYGHDPYTEAVRHRVAEALGAPQASVWFVWGGTAANVLSIRAVCRSWQAVVCSEVAHIHVDEAGAPEALAGVKLLPVAAPDGRLDTAALGGVLARSGDEHAVQPRLLSLSQSTELGTVYEPAALAELSAWAHAHGLLVHLDGARLPTAAAALGVGLDALTSGAGVDLLSFGGTKAGLIGAEAVVFLRPGLDDGFPWLRKQSLQLASKMRFLAAQFDALLEDDRWRALAGHANEMAARLAGALAGVPDVRVTRPVQANAVFATLPARAREALLRDWHFYVWDEATGEVRWMCAWDTTPDDVDRFAADVRRACAG